MWSETIRTVDQMEFMIFPRILALAERAWHKASWEDTNNEDKFSSIDKDWKIFATVVAKHELPRLEKLGIKYRIPPPGIRSRKTFKLSHKYGHLIIPMQLIFTFIHTHFYYLAMLSTVTCCLSLGLV